MDGVRPALSANEWQAAPLQARQPGAMAAAAAGGDLVSHLEDLAADDKLVDFLGQTDNAIAMAQSDPTFAETLDPLLGRIQGALAELPTGNLSRAERDAVAATQDKLDAY